MPVRPFQAQTRVLSWKGNSTVKGNRRLGLSSHVFLESPSHPRVDAFSRLPAPRSRPPSRSCHCSNTRGSRFFTQTPPEALELLLPPGVLPVACWASSCSLTAYHPRSRPTGCPPTTAAHTHPSPLTAARRTQIPVLAGYLHSRWSLGPVYLYTVIKTAWEDQCLRLHAFPCQGPWFGPW